MPAPDLLRGYAFFAGFGQQALTECSERLTLQDVAADEILGGDGLWLLLEGQARVRYVQEAQPTSLDIGDAAPGVFVGHAKLLLGVDEPTVLVASRPSRCLHLTADSYHDWIAGGTPGAARFQRLLALSLVRQLRVANRRLVDLVNRPQLRDFARNRGLLV